MTQDTYKKFYNNDLILRDQLAIDRTLLANERTFLAYVRTMIGFVAIGGTILKLFNDKLMVAFGWSILGLSAITVLIGLIRYLKTSTALNHIQNTHHEDSWQNHAWSILERLHLAKIFS